MSTAATVTTVITAAIATAGIIFVACYMQTKRFKITRLFIDRYSEAKAPGRKKGRKGGNKSFSGNNEFPENTLSPENTGYFRAALISDLHFPMFGVSGEDVIYKINHEDCDLVLVAGDLCQNGKGKDEMLAFMKRLADEAAGIPVLVVLGNHDATHACGKNREKIAAYCAEIEKCGGNVKVLRNEIYRIGRDGEPGVVVAGFDEFVISDTKDRVTFFETAAKEAGEKEKLLLLMHNPDIMEDLRETVEKGSKYCVTVAGHTHGGQVWLPFGLEFKLLRGDSLPRKGFVYGLYDYCRNNRLYITCGLGQSFLPIRFGTTPEIAFICF